MSRVALALKTVLARADETPTLVFDEVDAGIGGRSADPVGGCCGASRATTRWCASRTCRRSRPTPTRTCASRSVDDDGRTATEIASSTTEDERVVELAQMLGGEPPTPSAIAAARDCCADARQARGVAA